jgi:hypothetical protein
VFLYIAIFFSVASFSQEIKVDHPQVRKALIDFNGGKYNGFEVELNASPDIVEEVIKQKFKSMGTKPKETKGFMVFRNVILSQVDATKSVDAIIRVEKKSKKEKEQSIVSFIAAPAGEIPEDKIKGDAAATAVNTLDNGDAFLLGMLPAVNSAVFDKDLTAQQLIVKKEEKTLANLKDDQSDLEKKIKKLQSDLEYNIKAQEKQTIEVDKMKNKLSELLSKKTLKVD